MNIFESMIMKGCLSLRTPNISRFTFSHKPATSNPHQWPTQTIVMVKIVDFEYLIVKTIKNV